MEWILQHMLRYASLIFLSVYESICCRVVNYLNSFHHFLYGFIAEFLIKTFLFSFTIFMWMKKVLKDVKGLEGERDMGTEESLHMVGLLIWLFDSMVGTGTCK